MNDYYNRRKEWFENNYWGNNHEDLLIPNGIICDSEGDFNTKLEILSELVNTDGKIIDLGCGNGLLLKRLLEKSSKRLIPFGIDFLEKSIQQAKNVVLPKYKDNFHAGNVVVSDLGGFYDYIIADPESASDDDIELFYYRCFNALTKNGTLIFFIPQDTYARIGKRSNTLMFLESKNLVWFNKSDMLCGYISKE